MTYNGLNIGEGYDEFERYDAVKKAIEENQGKLTREQTIDLLAQVGVHGPAGEDKLQWSVVYNLTTLQGYSFVHRNKANIMEFSLEK